MTFHLELLTIKFKQMKKIYLSFLAIGFWVMVSAQEFTLELFAGGLSSPVELAHAGDDRLFVVEQGGTIKIINADGTVNGTAFLNISSQISSGGERGLLGLAFDPNYETNGRFYVNYTNTSGNTVIARYTVSENPDVANPDGTILLTIDQPFSNHNGGNIKFGPDGYLWIAMGDGGSGGDPNNNGQNIDTLLGKMLRIDVSGNDYTSPADNPFVGEDGADEIWSYGVRNPWKFSFDKETGDVWIADVGQNAIEEINYMPSNESGLNYGWRCYEGNDIYNNSGCANSDTMTFPVATYNHSGGKCSITGGYVYRGESYPNLIGTYFYADYCSGEIGTFALGQPAEFVAELPGVFITTFGEDVNGELYLAGSGKIYKIIGEEMNVHDVNKLNVSVYPNPVIDYLDIESDKQIESISIYTIDGKLMSTFENATRINFSSYSKGNYLLMISYGKMTKTVKITKK